MNSNRYSMKIFLILLILLFVCKGIANSSGWELLDTNIKTVLPSIFFLNDRYGWGVSVRGGTIYYTEDGGKNWNIRFTAERTTDKSYFPQLNSIYFADKNNGWVVGNNHIILHTSNGGQTWSRQESGLEPLNVHGVRKALDLFSVHFVDNNYGWAVGFFGTIINTNNGGLTWDRQKSGTDNVLWKVFFVDQEHGWAVGSNGTILYTENGGKSRFGGILSGWKKQESNTDVHLFDVFFLNQYTGWVVGADEILYTENGGRFWKKQQIGQAKHLRGVRFINKEDGWVVGTNKIFGTKDGGRTWQVFDSGTQQWLHNIFFLDTNHGWISGGNGTMLRYVGDNATGK
jgi:photosystem II stability/assembly factor-like uncharacterized protein